MKKKILFELDFKNWAFYYLTKAWAEELREEYDFYYFTNDKYRVKPLKNISSQYYKLYNFLRNIQYNFLKKFSRVNHTLQFIHPSKKFSYPKHTHPYIYNFGGDEKPIDDKPEEFDYLFSMAYFFQYIAEHPFKGKKNIVGIFNDCYPHLGPEKDLKDRTFVNGLTREEFFNKYIKHYDYLLVANKNLENAYLPLTDKVQYCLGIYKQNEFGKIREEHNTFTLGWTGNPNRSVKGFYEVIVPAVEKVKATGRNIHLKTAFNFSYEDMITFYNDVDLAVIASDGDGAPTMFCEASLCGIPSISTRIGLPSMVIQDRVNGHFINRDIDEMADAIIYLFDNPDVIKKYASRIKEDYLNILDNKIQILNFKKILERA
ncbi:hypothetical protein AP75_10465 [Kaistella haifensis DSM 19056]|uniref:Glycosyl transferase family 1 domain-containing protein n=1 Tax=Kaistella haifensis DSM 19056 TaxID=1450526 RepID=A0A246B817_9FLAO|nr:glycosyltransferase [Kaistella haifensis]OWK97547.1 hypothetical protein AP75_10465 [Kaistella haifensis DSM 19056]